jgi:hypothetical protein
VPPPDPGSLAVPYYGRIALPDTPLRARILDLFAVTVIATPDPPEWLASRYTPRGRLEDAAIFANPEALPRARWVGDALPEPRGLQAGVATLVAAGFDARARVLLDPAPLAAPVEPGRGDGSVVARDEAPERIALRSRSGSAGYVVLADAWFPGWEARIDGDPAPVLRADLAFRAVAVPAGEHELVLRYRPLPLRVGFALAALAASAAAVAYAMERRISRARSSRSP